MHIVALVPLADQEPTDEGRAHPRASVVTVASYSKQMMEHAQEWLRANSDPRDPFIRAPLTPWESKDDLDDIRLKIERWERQSEHDQTLAAQLVVLKEQLAKLDDGVPEIRRLEADLHREINGMYQPGVSKHQHRAHMEGVGSTRYAELGRWFLAWARSGYSVLTLGADFTAAMLLTDSRELDIEHVRLPFNGFLMLIPDGFVKSPTGSYTKVHISEIPRVDVRQLEAADKVAAAVMHLPAKEALSILTAAQQVAEQPTSFAEFRAGIARPAPDPDDTLIHIHATDGSLALDTLIDRKGLTWAAFDALDTVASDKVTDDDRQACHTLRQIVFQTLAYIGAIQSAMVRVQGPVKRRTPKRDAELTTYDVGRSIKIEPTLVRAVRAGTREIAFRLKHRHIVRGHYRNQPVGEGRQERKRIWITPFWRGPEEGAALVHTYRIDEDKP